MDSSEFQFQFIHLNSIESTNIYALELLRKENVIEGTVISTRFQEKGKGQLGASWQSDEGKNLQMSIVIRPKIEVERQFELSQMVALSLKYFLDSLAVEQVQVKWPNDILVKREKIAGVLIENTIQGNQISASVIGIGLNVNQVSFDSFNREATSLKLELQQEFDVENLLSDFLEIFKQTYLQFKNGKLDLHQQYLNLLYGYGKPLRLRDADGEFLGVTLGTKSNGILQVNRNGKLKNYDLKELQFLE